MAQQEPTFDTSLLDQPSTDDLMVPPEFDQDADYAAPPPPVPDGWYQATLSMVGVKNESKENFLYVKRPWGNIPQTFHTSINARIIDPGGPQDGKFASDNTVTTHTDPRRHNTSKVNMYYRAITGKPVPGVREEDQMKAMVKEVLGSPVVWIKTQLEGQAPDASKNFSDAKKEQGRKDPVDDNGVVMKAPKTFRGDKSFMENGKLTGRAWDAAANEWVVGRAVIADVKKDKPQA